MRELNFILGEIKIDKTILEKSDKEIYKKQEIYFVDFFCFVDKLKIDKTSLLLSIKELGSNISFVDWI